MIYVDVRGQMGNAMFQLAFAHATARRLDTTFALQRTPLWPFFELGPWRHRAVRVARRAQFRVKHGKPRERMVEVGGHDDPGTVLANLRDGVAYGGYFQGERWFQPYEDDVRAMFTVLPKHRAAFDAWHQGRGPYVCLHVRRGDYRHWDGGIRALPAAYFRDALERLQPPPDLPIVVVSDEPEAVSDELAGVPNLEFPSNPAIVDLQILAHAQHVVTSNSSFSWWGAWLNQQPGLRVIAPQHWLGFPEGEDYHRETIPARWEAIPVRTGAPV